MLLAFLKKTQTQERLKRTPKTHTASVLKEDPNTRKVEKDAQNTCC